MYERKIITDQNAGFFTMSLWGISEADWGVFGGISA